MARKRFRLLIIDDEQDFLDEIKNAFEYYEDNEFEIETAISGDEGMEKLRERRFDAALIDIQMPDSTMSGLDVIKTMNKEHIFIGTAIATGHSGRKEAVVAVNLGAQAWFDKPLINSEEKLIKLHQRLKDLAQIIPDDMVDELFNFHKKEAA
ncbi:MAG: response regulator [Methylococcales bacterium]|nr:response regulator [Methylococcales bacterium]